LQTRYGVCGGPCEVGVAGPDGGRPGSVFRRRACRSEGGGVRNHQCCARLLRNSFKCELSERVAQLVKDGNLDVAFKTMQKHFPELKISKVINILKLIYDNEKCLRSAIGFVEKLRVEFKREAYEALYENVQLKGHSQMPEILLLQRNIIFAGGRSELLKQVDEDCNKIVDRIVEGVRAKNHELSTAIVKTLGSSILEGKMALIVEKVHSAGTLEDTLLLLKFSRGLTKISCQCILIQALFSVHKSKNLLATDQSMNLWAHVKDLLEYEKFTGDNAQDKEKCTSICTELSKNLPTYFEIYQGYVESQDGNKIFTLHKDNWQLQSILPQFIDFYYDGDLVKAGHLLWAANNMFTYLARFITVNSLYQKMVQFGQSNTFEVFRIFTLVKSNLGDGIIDTFPKQKFRELQKKAPPCLRLLLWPKPAGAKFRLVNKVLKTPLFCVNMKVLCGIPPASCRDAQSWIAEVDPSTGNTTFKSHEGKSLNGKTGAIPADLCSSGTQWKVKAVDDHHVKLYFDSKFFYIKILFSTKICGFFLFQTNC
jgi:hypothetical protein